MTIVFVRWTFVAFEPTEADPPEWIGRVAVIIVLAGSTCCSPMTPPRASPAAPAVEVLVALAWATATFWFPLMIAIAFVATSSGGYLGATSRRTGRSCFRSACTASPAPG